MCSFAELTEDFCLTPKYQADAIARSNAALTTLVKNSAMTQAEADSILKACNDAAAAV